MAYRTESTLFGHKPSTEGECCTMNTAAPRSAGRSEMIDCNGTRLPADPPITMILTFPNSIRYSLRGSCDVLYRRRTKDQGGILYGTVEFSISTAACNRSR